MLRHALALVLGIAAIGASAEEELTFLGRYTWETDSVYGLSGLEIIDNGAGFVTVTDPGWWLKGTFTRDGTDITGVEIDRLENIIGQDGYPVSARRLGDWSDAEGLALAPDGQAWVSFERWARVSRFDAPFARAHWIKDHPTFYDLSENWQLEAVAIDPSGQVFAFPEKPLIEGFPIYRLGPDNRWVIDGYLPERDVFAIVGADFAPDGTLYLLERKLVVGIWWQSRIRRIRMGGLTDETLWTSERGTFGNLEGISVWDDGQGLRMTMVSDNNGSRTKHTEFVEFRLTK